MAWNTNCRSVLYAINWGKQLIRSHIHSVKTNKRSLHGQKMTILVTGGAGYIELLSSGNQVLVLDNQCNSKHESLSRVEKITGKKSSLYRRCARRWLIAENFQKTQHRSDNPLFRLKGRGWILWKPLVYYENSVMESLILIQKMEEAAIKSLVFSSSATVCGDLEKLPLTKACHCRPPTPTGAVN